MGYKRLDLLPPDSPLEPMFPCFLMPKEKPLKGGSVSTPIALALTYLSKAIFSDKVSAHLKQMCENGTSCNILNKIGTCKINRGLLHGIVDIEVAHLVGEQSTAYDVAFIDCEGSYPYPFTPDLFESPNSD